MFFFENFTQILPLSSIKRIFCVPIFTHSFISNWKSRFSVRFVFPGTTNNISNSPVSERVCCWSSLILNRSTHPACPCLCVCNRRNGRWLCDCNRLRRGPVMQKVTLQPSCAEVNGIGQISIFRRVTAYTLSRTTHRGRLKSKWHFVNNKHATRSSHTRGWTLCRYRRAAVLQRCNEPRADEEKTSLSLGGRDRFKIRGSWS